MGGGLTRSDCNNVFIQRGELFLPRVWDGGLDKIRESFYKAMEEVVKNFSLFENCKKINFILNVASDTNDFVRAKVVSYLCKFVKDMYKPD